jgi:8-oxo-dGTP pyrophosphatase MutT (NUDIX family)
MAVKVCPIVLRERAGSRQILVFRHPSAGVQLVKGGLENGEEPAEGALRELAEESGINKILSVEDKGTWNAGPAYPHWHFFFVRSMVSLRISGTSTPSTTVVMSTISFGSIWTKCRTITGSLFTNRLLSI